MPELTAERRGKWSGAFPTGWADHYRGHQYGPHRDDGPPLTVTIGHPAGNGEHRERDVPQPRVLVDQRRRINTLAYLRGAP